MFQEKLNSIPHESLAFLPTPLHELTRFRKQVGGPRLFIKRDDQTGLATGGNKTRKLEYLIADAKRKGADTVITAGAPQSNHCRQTAAAATLHGLSCELVFGGKEPKHLNGNILLDHFLGANFHFTEKARRNETMEDVAANCAESGRKPYIIPVGGSNGVGALGYVKAFDEAMSQAKALGITFDRIVFATSSGGTQAGLEVAKDALALDVEVLGISVDQEKLDGRPYQQELAQISNEACELLGIDKRYDKDDFRIQYDYLGDGYGVVGDLERNAISVLAQTEGILLDPVYAGRGFGGYLDLIENNFFDKDETILFWHTGGSAALFEYASDLV